MAIYHKQRNHFRTGKPICSNCFVELEGQQDTYVVDLCKHCAPGVMQGEATGYVAPYVERMTMADYEDLRGECKADFEW